MQVALRSAVRALALLAPALWIVTIGYCLTLLLLLDTALPGRSAETIVGLLALAAGLVLFHTLLLAKRQRILTALAACCDRAGADRAARQDLLRSAFLRGHVSAVVDALSSIVLIAVLAVVLGWLAVIPLAGASIAVAVLLGGMQASKSAVGANEAKQVRDVADFVLSTERDQFALLGLTARATEVVRGRRLMAAYAEMAVGRQAERVKWAVSLLAGSCTIGVVAGGTWMMARDAASHGALAAGVLLTVLVFHPLRQIAGASETLAGAYREWGQLRGPLQEQPKSEMVVALPPPTRDLEVSGISVPVPGTRRLTLQDISFAASAGELVAVIGPADAGKSMLLKVLTGQAPHATGAVRLDGAALSQWGETARHRHIGYSSQLPSLMPGTVAQNIADFAAPADPDAITRAAAAAGAHDAIVRLPSGYDTMLGDPDQPAPALSVQQRIAWARALFGEPFLVLLDNPGSFQDSDGHVALRRCLAGLRARGAVTIVVGDTASVIDSADRVLVMRKGGMVDYGLKEDVRARLTERQRREAERLAEVSVCADPRDTPAVAPMVE
ncbi:type I secretion system ATP-binding protein PrsD [Sphingomonas dokdonensis]|uniref:Type I secretion system ATP-binding protein PrsD n=1 Tax=Sphingomonas dokdonensis TaxID=344880 RepID=A0A245ZPC1_9SPHN|nr:type I secretion system ATP-binding protein PrsD [Sphingomonas dokdonensis]